MAQPDIYWAGTPNYTPGNYGVEALFPHWTCGGFDGSVSTLQNPARQASAHYVIEDGRVAQLVSEDDSAWHCGNYYYNMRAISYELVGWPGNPPSYETLDTCARMMADASRRYFGGAKLVLGENVMLHRWVYSTDCPGETDVDWLVNRANGYLEGNVEEEDDMRPADVWEYNYENTAPNGNMYNTICDMHEKIDNLVHNVWEYNYENTAPGGNMYNTVVGMNLQIAALSEAVKTLAESKGADPDVIAATVDKAVKARLEKIKLKVSAS